MSRPQGRVFSSRRITTKALVIFSLIAVGSICTLLFFPRALAAPIVSDNFNDNSIDTAKWNPNDLFSGFTNTNVAIAETSQRLEIGPLLQNVSGSSYRGMRTVNTYNFNDAYAFVELVQAPASNTGADAMFTIGDSVTAYYRLAVTAGSLKGVRNIGGVKTTLFSITYDSTNHRFLRIRHTSTGAVTLDTAPGSSGVPGTWSQQYSEIWSSSIPRTATIFEVKGGTSQVEANAPGKVIFDNFEAASNSAPTISSISPNTGSTSGGTSVTITGTGFLSGATVTIGGTAATNVSVVSSTSITATTPAHAAGTVDVVVTNTDSQNATLTNGFTYSTSETVLVSDDFNDNSLDTNKWVNNNLFSGFTNTNVPIAETSQRLEIGPLLQNVSGSSYRGIRTVNSYNFTGGYTYVELVQAAASNTSADSMFTVGNSVTAYYRIFTEAGNLIGQRNIGGTKTTLFSITYDLTNHRFLRIRHDSSTNSVTLDTAPGNSGTPGTWTQRYTETWNSNISTSGILFEVKGGTFQVEANAPGKVIFDNFHAAVPGSGSGNQISNINVPVNCNTSALINFTTSAASRAFIEYGTTTSYGSSTIDDPVRFYTEHAIQLTGLSANTTYHYRVNANSNGITQSADQTFTTASSGATCTALPVQVDSRMPDMTGAVEKTVKASGGDYTPSQFQAALNDAGTASEKRIITVDAGLTLSGVWTLPANADQNWIVIRSSQHAQLPEGKRVVPADASKLFKIQNTTVEPTIFAAAAANHIRIIGAEITIDPSALADAPGGFNQSGLIMLHTNLANNAANIPKFIGFDRCYVHGLPTKNTGRGLLATWEDSFVIDSYFDEFHFTGFDGQAILFVDAKRNKILNNTLIGVGENFMWGGTSLTIDNYVIGQLEFLRNHLYVPCKWKPDGGCGDTFTTDWIAEKNLFECKTCAKLFVFGNYLGGTTDAQGGFWPEGQSLAINLKLEQDSGRVTSVTVTNGGSGYTSPPTVSFTHTPGCVQGECVEATATVSGGQVTSVTVDPNNRGMGYCLPPTVSFSGGGGTGATATASVAGALELMEDIVWYKNFMKNVHAGTSVVGHTINGASNCGITPDRVLFKDNVFELDADVWDPEPFAASGDWSATGWFLGGTQNLQIIHNTIINANPSQSGACNSVFSDGSLILVGDRDTALPKWSGFVFKDNVTDYRGCGISGSGGINHANNALDNHFTGFVVDNNGIMRSAGAASNWPGTQLWATSWTSRLVNFNSGRDGNYRISTGTAWKNAATDGRDLGADVDGVEGATANAPTGNWPTP
ncbi:MAG TPA: IPT/TIG domain-containing protein [Pyrinomonadaceae bacterium]|nr:IPT/TIG domain-containing protein [Pyrinomonadaceae bacterium]